MSNDDIFLFIGQYILRCDVMQYGNVVFDSVHSIVMHGLDKDGFDLTMTASLSSLKPFVETNFDNL